MNKLLNLVGLVLLSSILFVSCDGKTASKSDENVIESENRKQASSVIEFRKKEEPKPMAIVLANYWEYEFVFSNQKMSAEGEHAGEWIKFEDDWTYNYGTYEKQQGSGRYHHSFNTSMLVLLDDKKNVEPVEYETKFGQDVVIFVGRPTYGQNGSQMKLRKTVKMPKKDN